MMKTVGCLQLRGFKPRFPTPRVTTRRIYASRSLLALIVARVAVTNSAGDIGMSNRIALAE
jgi:hypothetical protein